MTAVSVAGAWTELINKLDFKRGRISLLGIELGSALGNKLKCRAVVIAITKNIINSFKLGTILGIALGMGMRFKLGT